MADTSRQSSEPSTPKLGASKDKNCPYCGQAFTSSSLGRHLDLYIKAKNPKPPDGIHDVDAIRAQRGSITRRQPRASLRSRRDGSSTPLGTPRPATKSVTPAQDVEAYKATVPKDGSYAVDSTLSKYPFATRWEATGVINDLPAKRPLEGEPSSPQEAKRPHLQRSVSRQVAQKAQFDGKQRLADAMDTARAAELALRELLSSLRSAKIHIDNNSMPFEFDPLSLDFPALTLQCLKPPPTLFSSTQHPTSTSWSVQSPGRREYGALETYFQEQFEAWKVACASATTAALEEMTYPPVHSHIRDTREAVKKAEKSAESLEKQVTEHLQSAFTVWETLPAARQNELWILELARGVGRTHKETEELKQQQHRLQQENTNLKSQIDQLNRLQQPREFKLLSPLTIPLDRDIISHTYLEGVKGAKSIGFDLKDRHVDLNALVTKSIERWKSVITSTRMTSTGIGAQKPIDRADQDLGNAPLNSPPQTQNPSQIVQQPQPNDPPKRACTTSTTAATSEPAAPITNETTPSSIEETSDQDADAEMEDDDSFAILHTSPAKTTPIQLPQKTTLAVPRTRGITQQQQLKRERPPQHQQNPKGSPYTKTRNGTDSIITSPAGARRLTNVNTALPGNTTHGDMSMTMDGVQGDDVYME